MTWHMEYKIAVLPLTKASAYSVWVLCVCVCMSKSVTGKGTQSHTQAFAVCFQRILSSFLQMVGAMDLKPKIFTCY